MRTTCKGKTQTGEPCKLPPLAGKRFCRIHIARFKSKDPKARAAQLANLSAGRNGHNQHTSKTDRIDAAEEQERYEEIARAVPWKDEDGELPAAYRRPARRLARVEIESDHLDALASLTVRQERRRELLDRQRMALYESLALTPQARSRMARFEASEEASRMRGATPIRHDGEHVLAVLAQVLRSGGLPGELGVRVTATARQAQRDGITDFSTPAITEQEADNADESMEARAAGDALGNTRTRHAAVSGSKPARERRRGDKPR